jgi:hypothetical protein
MILASTNDDDPLVRAEACRALGRVGRPEDVTVLARIMILDAQFECKVAAIESLGNLKSTDRRILELMVAGMEHEQPVIRVSCLKALREITGKDLGIDALAWKKWLDETAPKPTTPAAKPDALPSIEPLPKLPETTRELPPEIP